MATSNPYVLFPNAIGPDDNRDNSQLSSLCQRRDGDSPSELRLLAEYPGTNGPLCRHLRDRKSTRLNSSHLVISYAVFCLKKKKQARHGVSSQRSTVALVRPQHTH